jgi:ubiquinone/menaquinone biosynthesis C-methylase UbiE
MKLVDAGKTPSSQTPNPGEGAEPCLGKGEMDRDPVYDHIGTGYDLTRRADPYLTSRFAEWLALQPAQEYLDLACGTGNYTIALAERGGTWTGLDESETMIESARQKSDRVRWVRSAAEAMPFPSRHFAGALCSLAIHHFSELRGAFAEARRVLAEGRFVLFTASREQMKRYWLNEYFPQAMARATAQMPALDEVIAAIRAAGFISITTEPYFVKPDLQDGFLYSGKQRPAVYLDEKARAGSSTFRALADAAEVESGCARLARDIETQRIQEVIARSQSEEGDYLFVVAATHKLEGGSV